MPLTERFIDQRFSYLNGRFIDEGQEGSSLKDVQMGRYVRFSGRAAS